MKIVSVILARGGSKGIPMKNLMNIKGKPLIAYTIIASLQSKVDETWVSSDDSLILKTARTYGANVLERPLLYASDTATSESALLHFAKLVEFDYLVFIQPTSPLLMAEDINKGIALIKNYDSVFSVYREHWMGRWSQDAKPIGWSINNRPRRQDAEPVYVENGAFYITSYQQLMESGLRYSGKIGMVEMPFHRSFQIDDMDDAELINALL